MAAIEDESFVREKAGVTASLGKFPWERFNPNGGSVAIGHPFGATGARILSQAVKELCGDGAGQARRGVDLRRRRPGDRRAARVLARERDLAQRLLERFRRLRALDHVARVHDRGRHGGHAPLAPVALPLAHLGGELVARGDGPRP